MTAAPAKTAPSRRQTLSRPACVAAAWCLLLRLACAVYAFYLTPRLWIDPALVHSNDFTQHLMPRTDRLAYALLGVWERFDTLWYLQIAQRGYFGPVTIGHYPLYPALIHVVSWLIHPPLVAALAISTVASFFLFLGLQKLLELDYPRATAIRAVYFIGIWPAAFMFFAAYPDALVGAFTVWAIYYARRSRWPLAGVLGALAALSKAVGCVVAVPLLVLGWQQRSWRAWPGLLPIVAFAAHSTWPRFAHYGFISDMYTRYWHTRIQFPWVTLAECFRALSSNGLHLLLWMNLLALVVAGALALAKGGRIEYRLYALAMIGLILTKGTDPLLQSTMRYVIVIFPAFLAMATLVKRPLPLIFLSATVLAVNAALMLKFFEWSLVV